MMKYTYRYLMAFVVVMAILAVLFFLLFPVKELMSIVFFAVPVLGVLWRFVNFIKVEDDYIEMKSFLKTRKYDYKDIEKIILEKDNSLHKGTLEVTVVYEGGSCSVPFGNLKYDQAKQLKRMIGDRTTVVLR